MRYYFAPLEGLTDSIYRQLHHQYFPGITQYYTPFFSPTVHHTLSSKELRELPPADTLAFRVVPQLLTRSPEDFLWMADRCASLGYREVNLNLGCPSGTVTAKGKGSGMLRDPEGLDSFLHAVFSRGSVDISVKTRLGFDSPEEFPRLLEVFNRYPIKELTVHPRVRNAFYKGSVDMDGFCYALEHSRASVCFNGNLCSVGQISAFSELHPQVTAVMIGRGLIADPGMLTPGGTGRNRLEDFYGALLEGYLEAFGGSRNAMFRLKENWSYLQRKFDGGEKLFKQLRKTTDLSEYKTITKEIFHSVPMRPAVAPDW